MEAHPLTDLFPTVGRDDLQVLAANIVANDLYHPSLIYDDQVLNVRNHLTVCQLAGVGLHFEIVTGT
ncbi:MAG: hypothetical protein ACE366_24715 [Bradymonadia bacterium]